MTTKKDDACTKIDCIIHVKSGKRAGVHAHVHVRAGVRADAHVHAGGRAYVRI